MDDIVLRNCKIQVRLDPVSQRLLLRINVPCGIGGLKVASGTIAAPGPALVDMLKELERVSK